MGDNITPPQQAFNWVADVYGSTEEIKARGQVIVGLLHEDIGHLGIFVSGKVAKKEHAQIVSVLESIEALPPGLYGMEIAEHEGAATASRRTRCTSSSAGSRTIARAEPLQARGREAVRGGDRGLRFQPARLRAVRAPAGAGACRTRQRRDRRARFHPLRLQRWAISDLQPVAVVARAGRAEAVKRQRQAVAADDPLRAGREAPVGADQRVARLLPRRARRGQRGAVLPVYGNLFCARTCAEPTRSRAPAARSQDRASSRSCRRRSPRSTRAAMPKRWRASPSCWRARASRCRCRALRAEERAARATTASCCRRLPPDEARRIRGEQEIIVRYEPERALATLPQLLPRRPPTASAC